MLLASTIMKLLSNLSLIVLIQELKVLCQDIALNYYYYETLLIPKLNVELPTWTKSGGVATFTFILRLTKASLFDARREMVLEKFAQVKIRRLGAFILALASC
jgi:hypothetical protein